MPDLMTPASLELGLLATGVGGGLALFLFGMRQMTESLKTVVGSRMKNVFARLTANRFTAALAGSIVTAVMQSSSVTTVLVVGFISAGLLNLNQSIGVIIGANVGTTITAQIIAFKIYKYGLLMIAVGFLIDLVSKGEKAKQWGMALMGLGLIFFGMELMSTATGPLRQWQPFMQWMQSMHQPHLAVLTGLAFTAIVQSSSATTGIVIVLASQGLISLETGIGLTFGANIGTCVTAMLSAVGRPRAAVQAAWVHVMFNVVGVCLWVLFIPQFAGLVRLLSPTAIELESSARLALETPRQIANAHTIFNVSNAFLFIWFTGPLARLVNWLVPERPAPQGLRPLYLNEMYLEQPAMALDQVRREIVRLAELDRAMLQRVFQVVTVGSRGDVAFLAHADDEVDTLYGEIVTYLGRLSQKNLIDPQSQQLSEFIAIANYLENFGDVIESNLLSDANKRITLGVKVSSATCAVLRPLHEQVCWAFDRALEALRTGDLIAARQATGSKSQVNELADQASVHLAKRLVAYEPNRLAAFQVETGIIENLKRLNTLTRRITRAVLELDRGHQVDQQPTLQASPGSEH